MSAEAVIVSFWNELFREDFKIESFAETLMWHFGHDGVGLTPNDVVRALRSEDITPWYEVGWACRETFVQFDPEGADSKEDFIAYVAMTLLWAEAVFRKHLEWDSTVDYLFQMTYLNLEHGSAYSRIRWFKFLFREFVETNVLDELT